MYRLLTFEVINRIFTDFAKINVSSMSRLLYLNCLMHHFNGKDATDENAMAFEMFEEDIYNYSKWKKNFQELHKAGVITITEKMILFNNTWGQFIDRTQLVRKSSLLPMKTAEELREDLIQNKSAIDVLGMKHNVTPNRISNMMDIFIKEQQAVGTKYNDSGEVSKHFIYWFSSNLNKIEVKNETVKSKGKIIGL